MTFSSLCHSLTSQARTHTSPSSLSSNLRHTALNCFSPSSLTCYSPYLPITYLFPYHPLLYLRPSLIQAFSTHLLLTSLTYFPTSSLTTLLYFLPPLPTQHAPPPLSPSHPYPYLFPHHHLYPLRPLPTQHAPPPPVHLTYSYLTHLPIS